MYVKPDLGQIQLEKLTPQHVQHFMNVRLASGLSARTVQYARAVLRCALGQALKWGLVARNVATLVDPPRHKQHEIVPLTLDEIKGFLRAISGHRFEAVFYVAIALGLREGEVLGLRWQDVDLKAATLKVNTSLQRIEGKLQLVEPKTARSRRTLPLPENVITMLRAHRVRQLEAQILAGSQWQEFGLVFTSNIGTPLIARNVVRDFHKILRKAGLPHHRFYDLRHSCASLLLAQGIGMRTIMEILGHSQIA